MSIEVMIKVREKIRSSAICKAEAEKILDMAIAEAEMLQAAAQGRAIKLAMAEANDRRLEAEKQPDCSICLLNIYKQEPVAWRVRWPKIGGGYAWVMNDAPLMEEHGFVNEPLYTSPPQLQPSVIDSDEKAGAHMEKALWDFIDTASMFPRAKPNPRTWPHVMVFAPQRQPLSYVDLRRIANQCGLGANEVSARTQATVDNYARAIEAAHGIKGEA